MGFILPRMAVGSAPQNAADVTRLRALGVTHVLDLRELHDVRGAGVTEDTTAAPQKYAGTGITYHRTPMRDDGRRQSVASYVDAVTFVKNAFAQPGTRVLIHCAAGMYRSPSVAYAVLRAMGYSPDDAWRAVIAGRSVAKRQYVPGAEAAVPSLPHITLVGGAGSPPPHISTVTHSTPSTTTITRPPRGTTSLPVPASQGIPTGAIVLGVVGLGIVGWTVYRVVQKRAA